MRCGRARSVLLRMSCGSRTAATLLPAYHRSRHSRRRLHLHHGVPSPSPGPGLAGHAADWLGTIDVVVSGLTLMLSRR